MNIKEIHVLKINYIGSKVMNNLKQNVKTEIEKKQKLQVISVKGSASKMTLGGKGPLPEYFLMGGGGNFYG